MTALPKEKESEVRMILRTGRQSRYAIIRDLTEYGMSEHDATDYVDHIASEVYDAPTAEERDEIREQHIQREQVGGYRAQIMIGSLLLVISLAIGLSGLDWGLLSILGAVLGLGLLLYGARIMMVSHHTV